MDIRKRDNDLQNTIHRKLRVEQHESHKTGVNSVAPERKADPSLLEILI
jgi:hypothetical protein